MPQDDRTSNGKSAQKWWQDWRVVAIGLALTTGNLDKLEYLGLPSPLPAPRSSSQSADALWREIQKSRTHIQELRDTVWELKLIMAKHGIDVPVAGPEREDGNE